MNENEAYIRLLDAVLQCMLYDGCSVGQSLQCTLVHHLYVHSRDLSDITADIQFRLRSTSQWIARIRVHLRANAIDRDQLSAWKTLLKCNAVLPYEMSPSVGDSLLFIFVSYCCYLRIMLRRESQSEI